MPEPVQRVLLKLSGEALGGSAGAGIDAGVIRRIAGEVAQAQADGLEIGVVLGGGNLFRGAALAQTGMDRVTGDQMGMLATIMNGLAFRDVLRAQGCAAQLMSAFPVGSMVAGFSQQQALQWLDAGQVVIFAGGTGNPFFTTDTAACLRAVEMGADLVLKATKVDGIYDRDPARHADARRFEALSYDDVIQRDLQVMDLTAICLCRDHGLPLMVFDMDAPGALRRIASGEHVGTLVDEHGA